MCGLEIPVRPLELVQDAFVVAVRGADGSLLEEWAVTFDRGKRRGADPLAVGRCPVLVRSVAAVLQALPARSVTGTTATLHSLPYSSQGFGFGRGHSSFRFPSVETRAGRIDVKVDYAAIGSAGGSAESVRNPAAGIEILEDYYVVGRAEASASLSGDAGAPAPSGPAPAGALAAAAVSPPVSSPSAIAGTGSRRPPISVKNKVKVSATSGLSRQLAAYEAGKEGAGGAACEPAAHAPHPEEGGARGRGMSSPTPSSQGSLPIAITSRRGSIDQNGQTPAFAFNPSPAAAKGIGGTPPSCKVHATPPFLMGPSPPSTAAAAAAALTPLSTSASRVPPSTISPFKSTKQQVGPHSVTRGFAPVQATAATPTQAPAPSTSSTPSSSSAPVPVTPAAPHYSPAVPLHFPSPLINLPHHPQQQGQGQGQGRQISVLGPSPTSADRESVLAAFIAMIEEQPDLDLDQPSSSSHNGEEDSISARINRFKATVR